MLGRYRSCGSSIVEFLSRRLARAARSSPWSSWASTGIADGSPEVFGLDVGGSQDETLGEASCLASNSVACRGAAGHSDQHSGLAVTLMVLLLVT